MNRRTFLETVLGAAGVMTLGDWRAFAAEVGLPAYYGDYLAGVSAKIRRGRRTMSFVFFSDIHLPSNHGMTPKLIARLAADTGVKLVAFGGDIPPAFGANELLDKVVATYRGEWMGAIEALGCDYLAAKGNHDFHIRANSKAKEAYNYDARRTRDVLMDTKTFPRLVTDRDNPNACYYHYDLAAERIRFIVADTSETGGNTISQRQVEWLEKNSFGTVPAGWDVVLMHHIPLAPIVDGDGTLAPLRKLVTNFQASGRGRVLVDLTGHRHSERQTFLDGLWYVTEPCDASYSDYILRSKPWCPDLPKKKRGTIFEQTFDVVQFDRAADTLSFVRVGGGGDRTLHLKQLSAKVGSPLAFRAKTLKGDFKWACYDAHRAVRHPIPGTYSKTYEYFNDVAEISADGTFTGKTQGESVVLALAPNGDKEMFAVKVV